MLIGSLAFLNLMALPTFEDEGTQLGWISRLIDAGEWQLPLAEGKPLEDWPMAPLFQLLALLQSAFDPAPVHVSVVSGTTTWFDNPASKGADAADDVKFLRFDFDGACEAAAPDSMQQIATMQKIVIPGVNGRTDPGRMEASLEIYVRSVLVSGTIIPACQ